MVSGNNSIPYTIPGGSGAALNGIPIGAVAYGNRLADGWGINAAGNDGNTSTILGGGGGSFSGRQWGVFSVATILGAGNNNTNRATFTGNYISAGTNGATLYVGARIGNVHYKILGTGGGSVSTTMATKDGEKILFAPESPENWFFDIGEVQLKNGKSIVRLDPLFIDCISDSKPFKVFVQGAEGTFGSIKVTRNQEAKTFELEDTGGSSNGVVQFSIHGIWKSKENLRFPDFLPDYHHKTSEIQKIKIENNVEINVIKKQLIPCD